MMRTYSDDVPCNIGMDSDLHLFTQRMLASDMANIDDIHDFVHFVERSIVGRIAFHNNACTDKSLKWPVKSGNILPLDTIAQCLVKRHYATKIAMNSNAVDAPPLGIFMNDDLTDPSAYNYYIYSLRTEDIYTAIRLYSPNATMHFMNDIIAAVRSMAPTKRVMSDENISPFKNGMLNRETRELIPYGPEYINTLKFDTNYNPNAQMPIIQQRDGSTWSPDQFIPSFTSDPEVAHLLMEGIAVALRPNKEWNIMFGLYATSGNNGKGTYCKLLRNILGEHNTSGINIQQTEQPFMLNGIESKCAIIGDENVVGGYLDDATTLKSLVTGDTITVNIKYQNPHDTAFHGFVVQCLNELPKLRDRSRSFARRLRLINFDQTFMGRENKYIKADYINRPEVLEWFVKVAMDMDFDAISEPKSCADLLNEYLAYNDPIRDFALEILPRYTWNLIPNTLAYEQYKTWMTVNAPNAKVVGRNTFIRDFTQVARETGDWMYPLGRKLYPSAGNMEGAELTIEEYNAESWINHKANLSDVVGRCTPVALSPQYQGIIRIPHGDDHKYNHFITTYGDDIHNGWSVSADEFMAGLNSISNHISDAIAERNATATDESDEIVDTVETEPETAQTKSENEQVETPIEENKPSKTNEDTPRPPKLDGDLIFIDEYYVEHPGTIEINVEPKTSQITNGLDQTAPNHTGPNPKN